MGFSRGFEKIAFVMPIVRGIGSVASKALGSGVRGAAKITSGTSGVAGLAGLGITAQQFGSDYKKNKNLALGAMQRA